MVVNIQNITNTVKCICCAVGSFCCIYTSSVVRTYAKVGDGVKIGSNVTIKNESKVNNDIDDGETI